MALQTRQRKRPRIATASPMPTIVAVCESDDIDAIRSALKPVHAQVIQTSWNITSVKTMLADALALILVTPLPVPRLTAAIRDISDDAYTANTPVFVLVPDDTPNTVVKQLYSAGAKAIFDWPREAFILSQCLLEMTTAEKIRIRPTEIDRALTQTVRTHLRLFRSISGDSQAHVNSGIAYLSGHVARLSDRDRIRGMIQRIPGIESVDVSQLTVHPTSTTDTEIKKSIQTMLRCTSEIDETTYWVQVSHQKVTIEGIASDPAELKRIYQLIANIKGIQKINDSVQISPRRKKRDRANVHLLKAALRICFPKSTISVAIFDGVAVLAGNVTTAAEKSKMESLALDVGDIERVVNKLIVRGG